MENNMIVAAIDTATQIEKIIEEKGLIICNDGIIVVNPEVCSMIAQLDKATKQMNKVVDDVKAKLLDACDALDVMKISNEDEGFTATKIAEGYRESFDSKQLKADDPLIMTKDGRNLSYDDYVKTSPVKASIRINWKK